MKNRVRANGSVRDPIGRTSALWNSIELEYADELASASWLERQQIRIRMQREFRRRKKETHEPSPATSW